MNLFSNVDQKFWVEKKVFLTGHTGFKGAWLDLWLHHMGAKVTGYSLSPVGEHNLFTILGLEQKIEKSYFADIRNQEILKKALDESQPDIVLHLAAQALVLEGYKEPLDTFSTNIIGTAMILEILRSVPTVRAILVVSSDKCYENSDRGLPFQETDPLGGYDPYSASKACVEIITNSYRKSFFQKDCFLASARAGNVIGGGDWSRDRLIPDLLKSGIDNEKIMIRNPQAIRPWQHVLEPLSGYLILVQRLFEQGERFAQAWNFGPNNKDAITVLEIIRMLQNHCNYPVHFEIDNIQTPAEHEAHFLKLNCDKSNNKLEWFAKWDINRALIKTLEWHQSWIQAYKENNNRPLHNSNKVIEKTLEQINEYHSFITLN